MKCDPRISAALVSLFALSLVFGSMVSAQAEEKGTTVAKKDEKENRVFELRTYTCHPGRLDALNKRFRDHTCKLFEKHGMTLIGFWTPTEGPEAENTLIYLLAFPSREARDKAFAAFREDPAWKKAFAESHEDGEIVMKVDSKFLAPTDYSYIK
ncbi:MAG: NIPSNAP family protein [Pirellulaceae bacterium]